MENFPSRFVCIPRGTVTVSPPNGTGMKQHRIGSDRLSATILAHGAEPVSIVHAVAGEVLWQAGPVWPKHAPQLFPIVGELAHGTYVHDGITYALGRHGFARDRDFTWTHTSDTSCTLMLEDDERTRTVYPFAFRLAIGFAIAVDVLTITYVVTNTGTETLPASVGAHPAFRWPLAAGVSKEAHSLTFASDEPEPIRRLANNLLDPAPFETPVRGRELALDPSLFDADAIVMDRPRSSSLRYAAPGAPSVDIAWTGFEQLGLWSRRGGDFLCIEPWYGYASPPDFEGDFSEKPGLMHLAAGASRTFAVTVRITMP